MPSQFRKDFLKNRGLWFLGGACALIVLGLLMPHWGFAMPFYWSAFCCVYVGFAYLFSLNGLLFKTPQGRVPKWLKLLLLPFFWGSYVYNWQARMRDTVEPFHEIEPGLFLGRRLLHGDLDELKQLGIDAILDVTAEYDALELTLLGEDVRYLNVPVFDHGVISLSDLHRAVLWVDKQLRGGRKVVIHCALGRGRSATALLAYLLFKNPERDISELVAKVKETRATVSPNFRQLMNLRRYQESDLIRSSNLVYLIFNPKSGRGDKDSARQTIREVLEPFVRLEVLETDPDVPVSDLVDEALRNKAKVVVAAGGDGTVSSVAGCLVGKDAALGILPMGTANALASSLYGAQTATESLRASCERILAMETQQVDMAMANDRLFLQMLGLGFERAMVEGAEGEAKKKYGTMGYLVSGFEAMKNLEPMKIEMTVDGNTQTFETTSLVVANIAPFLSVMAQGGGAPKPDDGMLDVTWLEHEGDPLEHALSMLDLLRAGMTDTPSGDGIQHCRGRDITIKCEPETDVTIDGEVALKTPLHISMKPASLRVISGGDGD